MYPLAHATHWIAGLLYLAPVIVLAVAILWQRLGSRTDRDGSQPAEPPSGSEPPSSGR